jgi:hypothetical protein
MVGVLRSGGRWKGWADTLAQRCEPRTLSPLSMGNHQDPFDRLQPRRPCRPGYRPSSGGCTGCERSPGCCRWCPSAAGDLSADCLRYDLVTFNRPGRSEVLYSLSRDKTVQSGFGGGALCGLLCTRCVDSLEWRSGSTSGGCMIEKEWLHAAHQAVTAAMMELLPSGYVLTRWPVSLMINVTSRAQELSGTS